jgi:hypothetical protein
VVQYVIVESFEEEEIQRVGDIDVIVLSGLHTVETEVI